MKAVLIPTLVMAVIPKKGFALWLQQLIDVLEIQLPPGAKKPEASDLFQNCPLFLVPDFEDEASFQQYIEDHYKAILINSLYLWCQDARFWPKEFPEHFTLEIFKDYFDIELHSRFYTLPAEVKIRYTP